MHLRSKYEVSYRGREEKEYHSTSCLLPK